MPILKPALCVAALSLAVALASPAGAQPQQQPQGSDVPAAGPALPVPGGRAADDRGGPLWRGAPQGRMSDDGGPDRGGTRRDDGRRFGQDSWSRQQPPQGSDVPAAGPAMPVPDGRAADDRGGPRWRGAPQGRSSDEGGSDRGGYRREDGRRFGQDSEPRERGMMGRGPMGGGMMGPGMMGPGMMAHGMMQPFGMGRLCGPDGARMGDAMIFRLERATQPTSEQRPAFDKLKEATAKAGDIVRATCTTERPLTPTGRLAAAEKRLTAMLEAVRTVRPAMDAYYGSLSDEQKARLTLAQPHMGRGGPMGEGRRGEREGRRGERQGWQGERHHGGDGRTMDRTQSSTDSDEPEEL